ncbi:MAG: PDZ domain-containing protein [Planctomycetes bacterium]|nr:PDZ domain-containing protein [Planctomycetota bacterium]
MWLTWMKALSIAVPLLVATGKLHAEVADDSQVEEVIVVQLGSDDEASGTRTITVRGGPGCCLKGGKASAGKILALPDCQKGVAILGAAADDSAGLTLVTSAGANPLVQLASLAIGLDDDGAGWLGVHLTEVPAPLSAQLGLEGKGVMVGNVVEDSPAEAAGLRRWDVIVSLDGRSVSDDRAQLVERIRGFSEGTDVDLTVIRNGEETDLEVTLGARPESAKTRWAHKFAPGVTIRERIQDRAHVLKLGEDGELEFLNLKSLPLGLRKVFPFRHGLTTRIILDDDRKSFNVVITQDDQTLEIEQEGDGEITVRRTDEDGNVTEAVYNTADDLAANDEEAFDVFNSMDRDHNVFILGDGEAKFDFDFDLDEFGDLHGMMLNLKELKGLEELDSEALEEAMEGLHEALKNMPHGPHGFGFGWKGRGSGGPGSFHQWREGNEGDADDDSAPRGRHRWFGAHQGGPGHSFRVAPDGSIELHIRNGDTEVIQVFEDEDDLAERNPELYEKYENTRKGLP